MHPTSNLPKEVNFHDSTTTFVQAIRTELDSGRGFAPFVGSGISAQSGILMSQDFSDYLAFCVWKVLGSPVASQEHHWAPITDSQPWDLANAGWPPYPRSPELEMAKQYLYYAFKTLGANQYHYDVVLQQDSRYLIKSVSPSDDADVQTGALHLRRPLVPYVLRGEKLKYTEDAITQQRSLLGVPDRPWDINLSQSSKSHIEEMAIRSLSHWTLTLEFLATTRVDSSKVAQLLYLTDRDISIIDSFNQHITRGKHPNLIHNLLARLARSLRSRVLLSTNFDCLLEHAFVSQGNPISTLSVSARGNLPPYSTVRAQDCLIKLHGDLLETRADSSINTPPQEVDKRRFFQYIRGPEHPHHEEPIDFVPSHLVVLGYSASDARCVQMIKYVLDLDKDFKVFWVCHTKYDRQNINTIFRDYIGKPERFHIVITDRTDLLLWELYQVINLSLPGGGYRFKFTHLVPPVPARQLEYQGSSDNIIPDLRKKIEQITDNKKIASINYGSGVVALARGLFQDFSASGRQTLWFELDDYSNTLELVSEALGAISLRRGSFYAEAVNFMPRELLDATGPCDEPASGAQQRELLTAIVTRIKLLCDRYCIVPENWVLFLYGRNSLGGDTGWKVSYWNAAEQDFFAAILVELAKVGFRIVCMPYGEPCAARNIRKVELVGDLAKELIGSDNAKLAARVSKSYTEWYADFHRMETSNVSVNSSYSALIEIPEPEHNPFAKQSGIGGIASPYEIILRNILNHFCHLGASEYTPITSARILWLYGLTLFRQSRNSTAMISEAVFPCPWKFNLKSDDNDEIRFRCVFEGLSDLNSIHGDPDVVRDRGWSRWLEDIGLFLKKPGGFYWVYRDIRLALQKLLELVGPIPLYTTPLFDSKNNTPDYKDWRCLQELRPRIHYWIAEWYLKAFHSTGHYLPLVEAIYHAASAIQLAPDYAAPKINDKRQRIAARVHVAWSSLCLLRQALRDGRQCFLYWCPGIDIEKTFFGEVNSLYESSEKLSAAAPESHLARRLKHDLTLNGLLDAEIRELKDTVIAEGYADLRKPLPSIRRMDPTLPSHRLEGASTRAGTAAGVYKAPHLSLFYSTNEECWRSEVVTALRKLFGVSSNDVVIEVQDTALEFHQTIRNLRFKWTMMWDKQGANFDDLYELAWGLSSLTYEFLRRAKLIFHSHKGDLIAPSHQWGQICVLAYHGLLLCRLLPPRFEARERELRVRMLSTYGLALGCLGRCWESNRRFHEAHALALSQVGEALPLQQARIQLRRAEMYLYQAWKQIKNYEMITAELTKSEKKSILFVHIDDAWAAIERGECALSGKNHSSFWWYRIAVTKLSCLAVLAKSCQLTGSKGNAALPMRRRQQLTTVIESLLMEALFAANGDDFRSLRAADYAQGASTMPDLKWGDSIQCTTLADKYLQEMESDAPKPLYVRLSAVLNIDNPNEELLRNYLTLVRERYKINVK
jgi:hypothetical protein